MDIAHDCVLDTRQRRNFVERAPVPSAVPRIEAGSADDHRRAFPEVL